MPRLFSLFIGDVNLTDFIFSFLPLSLSLSLSLPLAVSPVQGNEIQRYFNGGAYAAIFSLG